MFKKVLERKKLKSPAAFKLNAYRLVADRLTHFATLSGDKGKETVYKITLDLLFMSKSCTSQHKSIPYYLYLLCVKIPLNCMVKSINVYGNFCNITFTFQFFVLQNLNQTIKPVHVFLKTNYKL